MEIAPASVAQIKKGRNGRMVTIADDVQGVVNALSQLDPHLRVRYSEAGGYFVVYWTADPSKAEEEDHEGNTTYLVTTAQDLDHRLVQRVEEVYWKHRQPGYSVAKEQDEIDRKAERDNEHAFTEQRGEMYERLAYAMRRDLGYDKGRVFITKEIKAA